MTSAHPLAQEDRIVLLDALRGFALCGIVIMNVPVFSAPLDTMLNLEILNDTSRASLVTWAIDGFFLEGSCRALFSILFGAGSVLLISRLEQRQEGLQPADIYYRRLMWLLLFGLFNAYVLLWLGDILYHYALCGLFLFVFRKANIRLLAAMAAFLVLITFYQSWAGRQSFQEMKTKGEAALALEKQKAKLSEEQQADLEKWNGYLKESKIEAQREKAQKNIAAMQNPSYIKVWKEVTPMVNKIEGQLMHDEIFFDVMIFMLLGVILYRTGILIGERSTGFYWALMLGGYTLGFAHAAIVARTWYYAHFDVAVFLKTVPFPVKLYQLQRICVVLGHISLVNLLWRSNIFFILLKPLIPVGQMAFTNYLMQSMICSLIFFGYGFGLYGTLHRYETWYVVVSIWIFQAIFSAIWMKYFLFGPLEWLWRSLTYWKRQPFRRTNPVHSLPRGLEGPRSTVHGPQ